MREWHQGGCETVLGHLIAKAIGDARINIGFLIAQVVGKRYSAIIGFDSEDDARNATALIKKASAPAKKAPARKAAARKRK
ncbi:MAG: hypothetical protein ACREV2_14440 [Burkholderiales bacterium]